MMVPMPVTAEPDGASASICQASDPLRPPDCDGFQLAPVADVHMATSCCPGWPNRPAAVKPAEPAALRAVKAVSGSGELNGTCCQVAPPSTESSANGTGLAPVLPAPLPAAGVACPRATTRLPLIATCWSTAVAAPPTSPGPSSGTGRTIVSQEVPLAVVQTAGLLSCEPTETNPCAPAATASTWLEPVVSFTSCARVQLVRFGDHQTSATQPPPGATSLPTMTYPAGPEAAATADTPVRSWVMFPPATPQTVPSAEVRTTGPGVPTASQPAGPCVTLVSARNPGSAETSAREETSVQAPPVVFHHTAG